MAFLNIGKKDPGCKQARIEHRGKYLRASRTGGISLRAQAKAAGLNLTANSSHGFRVSNTVAKNTQVAMQNGRFVLRGRYGSGPTKLNVAKSGVTVSTKNSLGTFNWFKPNRSSAKVFGVQVRGKKAANAHAVFMLFSLAFQIIQLAVVMLWTLAKWTVWLLLTLLYWAWRISQIVILWLWSLPEQWRQWTRDRRNKQVALRQHALPEDTRERMAGWTDQHIMFATLLLFMAHGRGKPVDDALTEIESALDSAQRTNTLVQGLPASIEVVATMSDIGHEIDHPDGTLTLLAHTATLAQLSASNIAEELLPDWVLILDELILYQGPKNRLQELMLEVFCDFAGLTLEPQKT